MTTRRTLLASLIAGILAKAAPAYSRLVYNPGNPSINTAPHVAFECYWSYGQSWRGNEFPTLAGFGLPPGAPLAMRVSSLGAPTFKPGPLSAGAGIVVPGVIIGVQQYSATDTATIGRSAILTQQLLRFQRGLPVSPIVEFCTAYPGSTWWSGGGGGLSPGAAFTASITNDVMTVTAVASGTLCDNQQLIGLDVLTNTEILTGGPDGVGTYTIGCVFTTPSNEEMFGTGAGASLFFGQSAPGPPSQILLVTELLAGAIAAGQTITAAGVPANTTVRTFGTDGTTGTGGAGTYSLQIGTPQTLGSRDFTSYGLSWHLMLQVVGEFNALAPPRYDVNGDTLRLKTPQFGSFGYTQGGAADLTQPSKLADLTDLFVQSDALGLPGSTGRKGYFGLPAAVSTAVTQDDSVYGTVVFCQQNAPDVAGTYSGRAYFSGCSYPYQFNGGDQIHTGGYGTCRWGEVEGLVKHYVEDLGILWTPLWQSGTITVSGQVITIPWSRPTGPDFVAGALSFQSNADDGIKAWPQQGFHVIRAGINLTVTPSIDGLNTLAAITEALSPGDVLEVSYAWHGPGGPNPGISSGVGGNLVMQGPVSVLFPNGYNGVPKTIDAWAIPFKTTITV